MNVKCKCQICGKEINLIADFAHVIYSEKTKKGFSHLSCFYDYIMNRSKKKRSKEEADQEILALQEKAQEKIMYSVSPQSHKSMGTRRGKSDNPRLVLTDWLLDSYDLTLIPKSFYIKLNSVYSGEYAGLKKPCPPEDLFDMWKQKKQYLDKVAARNAQKDKAMTGVQRLSYDLAIILSKYDNYLEWREKQQNQQEQVVEREAHTVKYDNLARFSNASKTSKIDSIDSLLDEI